LASGASGVFSYDFQIAAETDLAVTADGDLLTLNVDYTVAGVGVETGGTITVTPTPSAGVVVTVYRDTQLKRDDDFQTAGDLPAAQVNLELDRLWRALQEIFSGGKGAPTAIRVPQGETVPALPKAADRASRVLAFDASGNPIVIPGVDSGSAAALAIDLANTASATKGDYLMGVRRTQTGAVATTQHAVNEGRWFDMKADGGCAADGVTTGDVAKIQAIINATPGVYWFPGGTWLWESKLQLPNDVVLIFSPAATIKPASNGLTIFGEKDYGGGTKTCYRSQIIGARVDGTGKTGTVWGDFTNMRQAGAGIYNSLAIECGLPIFRFGCYATMVKDFTAFGGVLSPMTFTASASKCVVENPIIDNQVAGTGSGTGTAIQVNSTTSETIGVQILGGYIQGFDIGIEDKAYNTTIERAYFEHCNVTDVYFNGARGSHVARTDHNAGIGACGIKARNSDAISVFKPQMGSGNRTGLLDFDGTNTNCTGEVDSSNASWNTPLGVTTGILLSPYSANYTVTDASAAALTFTQNTQAVYSRAGNTVTVCFDITYPVTASGANASINLPVAPKAGTTVTDSAGFTDYGSVLLFNGSGSTFGVYASSGGALTNANLSGKRIAGSITYITR
jgi:hypothetical protein